jgi:cysteine desulfurase
MTEWLGGRYGNPSGAHAVARAARAAIDDAREQVALAVGTDPGAVIFTSGGTEADNLAVRGVPLRRPGSVVVSEIEHAAVLEAARASGQEVRVAGVTPEGLVDLDQLARLVDPAVSVVSVMLANNEIGTLQPLGEVARLVRRRSPRALLHTDAVCAMPWLDVASAASEADLISVSAHKFGGPQGVGALAARSADLLSRVAPLVHGGGQERELRSGTHNVAGIVGMGAAAAALVARRSEEVARLGRLRDQLAARLLATVPGVERTAAGTAMTAGHLHLRIVGVDSEELLILLDDAGVAASAGSACASGAMEPSHVLLAMGVTKEEALTSLRLTLGWSTTEAEIEVAATVVPAAVARLRGGS